MQAQVNISFTVLLIKMILDMPNLYYFKLNFRGFQYLAPPAYAIAQKFTVCIRQ